MRVGFWLLLALVGTAFVGHFFIEHHGYVLVRFAGYRLETSVPIFFLGLLTTYFLLRLLFGFIRAPKSLTRLLRLRRRQRAHRLLSRGLVELFEGQWARSESLLARSAKRSEFPLLGYIGAARAAQLQGADGRRDHWLKLAYEQDPQAANAVLFTQAELQIAHQQYEQALATLRRIQDENPAHTQSLVMLAKVYRLLGDWPALEEVMPRIQAKKILNGEKLVTLESEVAGHRFDMLSDQADRAVVSGIWRSVSRETRRNPILLTRYIKALVKIGETDRAELILRKALDSRWDAVLIRAYAEVKATNSPRQLANVEAWMHEYPNDAELRLTAAVLAERCELWGKARSYFETSLKLTPAARTYELYGKLLERLHDHNGAREAYRRGLSLTQAAA